MERILLIEDDQALGRGTALALAGEGREIRVAATLAQGWAALGEGEYALVLLDLNLPDGNGLDFLTALRRTSGVPVLILTANDLESDQVAGLELGADDYMTKPFSLAVLRARVNRLLRRGSAPAAALELGPFSFDFERLRFMRNGTEVELSKTEQRLLSNSCIAPARFRMGLDKILENTIQIPADRRMPANAIANTTEAIRPICTSIISDV